MQKEIAIGFYTGDTADWQIIESLKDVDAALFVLKDLSPVKIKNELDGKSDLFLKMGEISKKIKGACFFSLLTDTYGIYRQSIASFYGGRLLSIADLNCVGDKFSAAFGLKSLKAGGIKFGVLVGSDVLNCDNIKALSLTENDLIINLSADIFDFDNEKLFSTLSFLYGLPIAAVSFSKKVFTIAGGETLYSGKDGFYKCVMPIKKQFKEKTFKTRV